VTPATAGYTRPIVLLAVLAALGFVGGVLAGLLGIGGGIVMVPLLLYAPPLLGVPAPDIRQVTGMTMVQVFGAALLGYLVHRRRRAAAPEVVLWMGGGMVLGTGTGAVVSSAVSQPVLQAVFATLALMAAPLLFVRPPADEVGEGPARKFSPGLAFVAALFIGFGSGLVGVGGAFLLIPVMIYLLGIPTRAAVGSSLGVLTLAGFAGAVAKLSTGQVPLLWATALCAGTLPGAWAGARVSHRVSARGLRLSLAVVVALTGLRMLLGLPAAWRGAR